MSDLSIAIDQALIGTPSYGDLVIENGELVLTSDINPSGTNVTQQFITQRLRLFLGEAFMNLDQGVPYYQQIFVKNADQGIIDALIQNTILGTPGVTALTAYNSEQNLESRTMTISFTAQTATGSISATVPVSP